MSKSKKRTYLFSWFAVLACVAATSAWAGKDTLEKRGTFGLSNYETFVTLDYSITFLGESYKPGHLSFQIDLEDTKGFDLSYEVVESECKLKNAGKQKVAGKVERISDSTIRILFPLGEDFKTDGTLKLYTVIRDYKLQKTFSSYPSSVAVK